MFNEKETKHIAKMFLHMNKMSDRLEKIYFNNLVEDGSNDDDFGEMMDDLLDVYHSLRNVLEKLKPISMHSQIYEHAKLLDVGYTQFKEKRQLLQ